MWQCFSPGAVSIGPMTPKSPSADRVQSVGLASGSLGIFRELGIRYVFRRSRWKGLRGSWGLIEKVVTSLHLSRLETG